MRLQLPLRVLMMFSLTTDPKKKLLYIVVFFVVLYLVVEVTGFRARLSPETIKDLATHFSIEVRDAVQSGLSEGAFHNPRSLY